MMLRKDAIAYLAQGRFGLGGGERVDTHLHGLGQHLEILLNCDHAMAKPCYVLKPFVCWRHP